MTHIMQTLRAFFRLQRINRIRHRRIQENIKQRDAIMALAGFKKDTFMRTIDAAVLAGRAPRMKIGDELGAWVEEHKTTDGFIETRSWLTKREKRAYRNRPLGDDKQPIDEYYYERFPLEGEEEHAKMQAGLSKNMPDRPGTDQPDFCSPGCSNR